MQTLQKRGDEVCISCPDDPYTHKLVTELGVEWHVIPSNPRHIVPHMELVFAYKLFLACKQFKPDVCLTYTPRVNCYITLVPLKTLGIRLIRNISGVGESLNSGRKLQTWLASYLYKRAFNSYWTFYQNDTDMQTGIQAGFSKAENTTLLPGSGVDLTEFTFKQRSGVAPYRFLLAARLIPAKGYLDFIALAKLFCNDPSLEFHLAGTFSNESGLSEQDFNSLITDAGVVYHGYTEDLKPLYQDSDMFILPSSYGEGLPRVLLEAAASGCALLVYDNPGSNRAVKDGTNGWVLSETSVEAMRAIVADYVALAPTQRQKISSASREHVENGFSEDVVIDAYLQLLSQ